jgi:hypothetical protein
VQYGAIPVNGFNRVVEQYNWLGNKVNKGRYVIDSNLARNLPGALLQDFLLNMAMYLCSDYPELDIFTEVRVPFGRYPLWKKGQIHFMSPSEKSDLEIGYLVDETAIRLSNNSSPKPSEVVNEIIYISELTNFDATTSEPVGNPTQKSALFHLEKHQSIIPLVTVNTKIRVSQSEFFDWLGREQLMTKGNPHCLSIQVALRKEMDLSIVDAAQAGEKFFLLGSGSETNVTPDYEELGRLTSTLTNHLKHRMR